MYKISGSFFFLLLLFLPIKGNGQGAKIWYFGIYAGVDFNTEPPIELTNSRLEATEGSATITDSSGLLLMYTNGIDVYNKAHQRMQNGFGLAGQISSTQSSLIIPQPGNDSIYFIFTTASIERPGPFCYSIVNMNRNNGLGAVVAKNIVLFQSSSEQLNSVKHSNGIDYWVIAREVNTNKFNCYLVTASGITNVESFEGPILPSGANGGQLKFSPDGTKLAHAVHLSQYVLLCDFNSSTGIVSNSQLLSTQDSNGFNLNPYGIEFSSSGRYLYGAMDTEILQWDVSRTNFSDIVNSKKVIASKGSNDFRYFNSLQLAPNRKIYVSKSNEQSLGVINSPESADSLSDFELNGIQLSNRNFWGLPNTTQSNYYIPFSITAENYCIGSQTTFSAITTATLSNFQWSFGDPASGLENTSTLSNPTHIFSAPGQYTITLNANVGARTYRQEINVVIFAPPTVNIPAGPLTFCEGQTISIEATASTNVTYQWYHNQSILNNDTLAFLNISNAGSYYVVVSNKTCTDTSNTINVTIKPKAISIIKPEGPLSFCKGDTIILDSNYSTGSSFQWYKDNLIFILDTLQELRVSQGGTYMLIVNNSFSCSDTSSVVVVENALPNITILQEKGQLCADNISLIAQGADSFEWNNHSLSSTIEVPSLVTFTYSVVGINNETKCRNIQQISILGRNCEITVPNVFSPNNDGINDFFFVPILEYQKGELVVYNRWGNKVFFSDDYKNNWNGLELLSGLYYYQIITAGFEPIKGWVEIVR